MSDPKRPSKAERKATKKSRTGWCPVDKVCALDCQNGCEKFDQKAFNERWRWA